MVKSLLCSSHSQLLHWLWRSLHQMTHQSDKASKMRRLSVDQTSRVLLELTTSNQKLSKHDARCFLSKLISHLPPFLFLNSTFYKMNCVMDESRTYHPPTWAWPPPWTGSSRSRRPTCWPALCGCTGPRSPQPGTWKYEWISLNKWMKTMTFTL